MEYENQDVKTQTTRRPLTAGVQQKFGTTTVEDTYKWPKIAKETLKYPKVNNQLSETWHPSYTGYTDDMKKFNKTTYAEEYVRFPVHTRRIRPIVSEHVSRDRNIQREVRNWRTTYEETNRLLESLIKGKSVERAALMRPPEPELRSCVFEGETEYQGSFFPQKADHEVYISTPKKVTTLPFRGISTMRSDYVGRSAAPIPHPLKSKGKLSPETRDFLTSYGSVYRKLPPPELSSSVTFMRHWNYRKKFDNVKLV